MSPQVYNGGGRKAQSVSNVGRRDLLNVPADLAPEIEVNYSFGHFVAFTIDIRILVFNTLAFTFGIENLD